MGKKVASIALPIIGNAVAPGIGGVIGGAAGGALNGGGLKGALIGAGTSFAGNAIGNSLAPTLSKAGLSGSIGSTLSPANAIGPYSVDLGGTAANMIGNRVANTALSSFAGNALGSELAGSAAESLFPEEPKAPEGPAPFSPQRENQLDFPGSLTGLSGLEDNQVSTNLATQGVYGGGVGPEEENYFLNMVNRRLVDDSGVEDSDLSEINPIENSFLSQIGLGGYADPRSLLEAISKRKQGAYAA